MENTDSTNIISILKKIPIFAELSEEKHNMILKNIVSEKCPNGHVFFNEGDKEQMGCMYIIKKGMVKISRKGETDNQNDVATLSDNDFFGEMALVTDLPRNATATAISECEILKVKKEDFMILMQSDSNMAARISEAYIKRDKHNSEDKFRKNII